MIRENVTQIAVKTCRCQGDNLLTHKLKHQQKRKEMNWKAEL